MTALSNLGSIWLQSNDPKRTIIRGWLSPLGSSTQPPIEQDFPFTKKIRHCSVHSSELFLLDPVQENLEYWMSICYVQWNLNPQPSSWTLTETKQVPHNWSIFRCPDTLSVSFVWKPQAQHLLASYVGRIWSELSFFGTHWAEWDLLVLNETESQPTWFTGATGSTSRPSVRGPAVLGSV